VPPEEPKTPTAVEDRSQQVETKRSGTNERIDMHKPQEPGNKRRSSGMVDAV
jgi:hypothetical protein